MLGIPFLLKLWKKFHITIYRQNKTKERFIILRLLKKILPTRNNLENCITNGPLHEDLTIKILIFSWFLLLRKYSILLLNIPLIQTLKQLNLISALNTLQIAVRPKTSFDNPKPTNQPLVSMPGAVSTLNNVQEIQRWQTLMLLSQFLLWDHQGYMS